MEGARFGIICYNLPTKMYLAIVLKQCVNQYSYLNKACCYCWNETQKVYLEYLKANKRQQA